MGLGKLVATTRWHAIALSIGLWSFATASNAAVLVTGSPLTAIGPVEVLEIPVAGGDGNWSATLDGMNVSGLLERGDGVVRITPAEALDNGRHTLVLYRLTDSGPRPLARYTFVVAGGIDSRLGLYASTDVSTQVAGDKRQGSDDLVVDGAFGFDGEMRGSDWEATGRADLFANTEIDAFATDEQREVDLGEYLFSVRRGRLGAHLGHHRSGPESLVMRGFNRRGASMSWESHDHGFAATTFAYRSEPVTGFEHGFGIGNRHRRVAGAVLSARPSLPAQTEISVTWLTGAENGDAGVGVVDDVTTSSGDAWSVAVVTRPLDGRLSVRGEYAGSIFESADRDSVRDDAWSLALESDRRFHRDDGRDVTLRAGVETSRVGAFFDSLANPGLPTDVERKRAHAALSVGGFSLFAQAEQQRNNVDDNSLLPTIRTDITSVNAYYGSLRTDGDPRWYGRPSLGLTWQRADQVLDKGPADLPLDIDFSSNFARLYAGFSYRRWDWRIGYNVNENDDRTGLRQNTESRLGELSFGWQRPGRFGVTALVQEGEVENLDTGVVSDRSLARVDLNAILVPRRWSARLGVNRSTGPGFDGVGERTARTVDAGINYTLREATTSRAGVALWLRGQHQVVDGSFGADPDDEYQVFFGITVDHGR